jgi:hypothetical protein
MAGADGGGENEDTLWHIFLRSLCRLALSVAHPHRAAANVGLLPRDPIGGAGDFVDFHGSIKYPVPSVYERQFLGSE